MQPERSCAIRASIWCGLTMLSALTPKLASSVLFASMKTPNASRRFRGHNFLPPIVDVASLSGNVLDPSAAYATAAAAYVAKLQTGCQPSVTWTGTDLSAWSLCIYSHAAAVLSSPSVAAVQLVTLKSKVSFLRSRERGGS